MAGKRKRTPDTSTLSGRELSCHENTQALEATADAQRELSNNIDIMQSSVAKASVPEFGHDTTLEPAHAEIRKTKTHIDIATENLPAGHIPRSSLPTQSKADKAFHVTEINEKILLNLGPECLLRVQQVDKTMFDTIQGSQSLQQAMFLKPRPSGPIAMFPPSNFVQFPYGKIRIIEGPYCPFYGEVEAMLDRLKFRMVTQDVPATYSKKMLLGITIQSSRRLENEVFRARVAKMLICQSAVYVMQVTMACCPDGQTKTDTLVDEDGHFALKAQHGITIRHIAETIKTMRRLHRTCGSRSEEVDGDGSDQSDCPDVWPEFRTFHIIGSDDPIFVRGSDAVEGLDWEASEEYTWRLLSQTGQYLTTSKEFKASIGIKSGE